TDPEARQLQKMSQAAKSNGQLLQAHRFRDAMANIPDGGSVRSGKARALAQKLKGDVRREWSIYNSSLSATLARNPTADYSPALDSSIEFLKQFKGDTEGVREGTTQLGGDLQIYTDRTLKTERFEEGLDKLLLAKAVVVGDPFKDLEV